MLCPLDLTTRHTLHLKTYVERVDPLFRDSSAPSEEGTKPTIHHFTSSILERTWEVMRKYGDESFRLHDPAAVWCAITNPPVLEEELEGLPKMQMGWKCQFRSFDIERTGDLTRGMLVVDRREPGKFKVKHGPGANRVELENAVTTPQIIKEVAVVCETPGSAILVDLLLERIWGCK